MKKNTLIAVLFIASSWSLSAQDKIKLKTDKDKFSYSIAINIAQSLKQQDMLNDVDIDVFTKAMKDEIAGKPSLMPMDSLNSFMQKYFAKKRLEFEKKRQEQGEVNKTEGLAFQLNRVIKGWTEGVALMTKGSKYRFYIPSELAYGQNGAGIEIGPNSVLIFDIELVDFNKQPETTEEDNSNQKIIL